MKRYLNVEIINPEILQQNDVNTALNDISDEQLHELVRLLIKPRNRNKPCVCKSGKKFKSCCLGKVSALQQKMKKDN